MIRAEIRKVLLLIPFKGAAGEAGGEKYSRRDNTKKWWKRRRQSGAS